MDNPSMNQKIINQANTAKPLLSFLQRMDQYAEQIPLDVFGWRKALNVSQTYATAELVSVGRMILHRCTRNPFSTTARLGGLNDWAPFKGLAKRLSKHLNPSIIRSTETRSAGAFHSCPRGSA